MIRWRLMKLPSSSRAPRGMLAQKPVGRDVVVPGVVTHGSSAAAAIC
jgi:hypothetical protein